MLDERSGSVPYDDMRRVEAAILALVLAEDCPWRPDELARRLGCSADVVRICAARLRADGLLVGDGETVRASWIAVRGDELAGWLPRPSRRLGEARSNVESGCGGCGPRYPFDGRP